MRHFDAIRRIHGIVLALGLANALTLPGVLLGATLYAGSAQAGVVSDGRFTNIYVFEPKFEGETWEQHIAGRRADSADFSRAAIDRFTEQLMTGWPSYFDPLQSAGIHPPRFFGSTVASERCVRAAVKDEVNGVLQTNTLRSLANCHLDGMDPSPQVNLILSPELKAGFPNFGPQLGISSKSDMCRDKERHTGYHAAGLNVPNFAVLPTGKECSGSFSSFTSVMSHEIVEMLADPMGPLPFSGVGEVADLCESSVTVKGYSVDQYVGSILFDPFGGICQPQIGPPAGSDSVMWILGEGTPLLQRLTGERHTLHLAVPSARVTTGAAATQVRIFIQTGSDDLRAGSEHGDNAEVELLTKSGRTITTSDVNHHQAFPNGSTRSAVLDLGNKPVRVSDITGINIHTGFAGGCCGDNWNIDKVALEVSFPAGSNTVSPPRAIVHEWLDVSDAPLVRLTGERHELSVPVMVPPADLSKDVSALTLIISTGNDDLRGGDDNCDVTVKLNRSLHGSDSIRLHNVNDGETLPGWTTRSVSIPIGKGLKGSDVRSVTLTTHFTGGSFGDNWNVERLQLKATLAG